MGYDYIAGLDDCTIRELEARIASRGKKYQHIRNFVEARYLFDAIDMACIWIDTHISPVDESHPEWDDIGHEIVAELETVYKEVERLGLNAVHYHDLITRQISGNARLSMRAQNWILEMVYLPIFAN